MSENTQNNDLNPDDLMSDFRSKGLLRIIIFTFVIHGVVLLGSSVPWMYDSLFSSVDENASEEERIKDIARKVAFTVDGDVVTGRLQLVRADADILVDPRLKARKP